jgi:hypothetical protein
MGRRDGVREPAREQKEIAGFFWSHGTMTGKIEYQIAEGNLVATRWRWTFRPSTWWMRIVGGDISIPIVNIFRFENGKVVEIWNHRYDLTAARQFGQMRIIFTLGFLAALGVLLLVAISRRLWRRRSTRDRRPARSLEAAT